MSFVIATRYAQEYPHRNVILIDMCPQANLSEIVLGGNGTGSENLNKLLSNKGSTHRPTIGGYFDSRLQNPHSKTGAETSFMVKAHKYNERIEKNVFLVAGDPSLELQTQAINQIAAQTLPKESWKNVHSWVTDLTDAIEHQYPNCVFFIDCNPSFSAYTELALLAANRLIVPCSADGSSARAIDNLGQLLFEINVPKNYEGVNFASKVRDYGLQLPSVHLVPLNRSTQYDDQSSKAFMAMYEEIKRRVSSMRRDKPDIFSLPDASKLFCDMPDAHTVSVVVSHLGLPLNEVKPGSYHVHDLATQVSSIPLERYQKALDAVIKLL